MMRINQLQNSPISSPALNATKNLKQEVIDPENFMHMRSPVITGRHNSVESTPIIRVKNLPPIKIALAWTVRSELQHPSSSNPWGKCRRAKTHRNHHSITFHTFQELVGLGPITHSISMLWRRAPATRCNSNSSKLLKSLMSRTLRTS